MKVKRHTSLRGPPAGLLCTGSTIAEGRRGPRRLLAGLDAERQVQWMAGSKGIKKAVYRCQFSHSHSRVTLKCNGEFIYTTPLYLSLAAEERLPPLVSVSLRFPASDPPPSQRANLFCRCMSRARLLTSPSLRCTHLSVHY